MLLEWCDILFLFSLHQLQKAFIAILFCFGCCRNRNIIRFNLSLPQSILLVILMLISRIIYSERGLWVSLLQFEVDTISHILFVRVLIYFGYFVDGLLFLFFLFFIFKDTQIHIDSVLVQCRVDHHWLEVGPLSLHQRIFNMFFECDVVEPVKKTSKLFIHNDVKLCLSFYH